MLKKIWLGVCCGMLGLMCVSGCASISKLGNSSQVFPSSLGLDVGIDQLRSNAASYDVMYSGPKYNPSAILFVPLDKSGPALKLTDDWKPVAPGPDLDDLFWKIDMGNPNLVKLKAVVPPEDGKQNVENVMAFIYTKAYASMQKVGENTYKLRGVPEQFNPNYHDGSSAFDQGVAR